MNVSESMLFVKRRLVRFQAPVLGISCVVCFFAVATATDTHNVSVVDVVGEFAEL